MKVLYFIIENWAQFSFLLLGVGYIIKAIVTSTFKKKEIKYSIFYQQKIDVIKNCLQRYNDAKDLYFNIPYWAIFKNEITSEKIDELVQPILKKVSDTLHPLLLFYGKDLHDSFNVACSNIKKINNQLMHLYLDEDQMKAVEKVNSFVIFREKIYAENNALIDKFIFLTQKSLKISTNNSYNKPHNIV